MKYLFHTNVCIFNLKRDLPAFPQKIQTPELGRSGNVRSFLLRISSCRLQEPAPGLKHPHGEYIPEAVPVLPFFPAAANHYGHIRKTLEQKDSPIAPLDLLIAAHALALKLMLVTSRSVDFSAWKVCALKTGAKPLSATASLNSTRTTPNRALLPPTAPRSAPRIPVRHWSSHYSEIRQSP